MHSNNTITVVITKKESQHHHYTTQVSTKKERKEGERIKVAKKRERSKGSGRERESIEWQACTNRLFPSLPLKDYPLLRIKDLFGHKPFRPVLSKWIISIVGFSCEVVHVEAMVPSLVLVL